MRGKSLRRRNQSGCKRWSSGSHLILFQKLDGAASMLKLTLSLSQVEFVKLTVQLAEGLLEPLPVLERFPLLVVSQQQA